MATALGVENSPKIWGKLLENGENVKVDLAKLDLAM